MLRAIHRRMSPRAFIKQAVLLFSIIVFVLGLNASIIALDLMYAEQPLIYVANQSLHSWLDLVNIYLHPAMLDIFSIPFFRPSGHFLLYQLITPLFGWHHTQFFIIVNLVFLGLTGYILLKLYELLFPTFQIGGFIALGAYLMQPSLILSRLIVLHFEFAYIFFMVLSLYLLARSLAASLMLNRSLIQAPGASKSIDLRYFISALFFYALAVSFKEPALMLGPVLALYLFITRFSFKSPFAVFYDKQCRQAFALITILSLGLGLYLTMPWPTLAHPLEKVITWQEKLIAAKLFLKIIFSLPIDTLIQEIKIQPYLVWRNIVTPRGVCLLSWALWILLLVSISWLVFSRHYNNYKRSCIFLIVSAILFLILPISWAMGLPWHLSPTWIFLSLLFGFGAEFILRRLTENKIIIYGTISITAMLLSLSTMMVNQANIHYLLSKEGFSFTVARNAVMHPPAIKSQLSPESIVVVEDSILHNSYALGNSGYTFLSLGNFDYDAFQALQRLSFLKFQPIYNGHLFKWAYLMPELKEEVYPFAIEHMETVPDAILYNWLQHSNNVFCVGYDRAGNWYDKTVLFRKKILEEKNRRFMRINQYTPIAATAFEGSGMYIKNLVYPDEQLCQLECDQNIQCKGFIYQNAEHYSQSAIKCQFFDSIEKSKNRFCATCIGFIKET